MQSLLRRSVIWVSMKRREERAGEGEESWRREGEATQLKVASKIMQVLRIQSGIAAACPCPVVNLNFFG